MGQARGRSGKPRTSMGPTKVRSPDTQLHATIHPHAPCPDYYNGNSYTT